jgi:hypothetical protein
MTIAPLADLSIHCAGPERGREVAAMAKVVAKKLRLFMKILPAS